MGRSPSPRRTREKTREKEKKRKRSRSRRKDSEKRRRHYSTGSDQDIERARTSRSRSHEKHHRKASPSSFRKDKMPESAGSSQTNEEEMMRVMGFSGFNSTKGKKVEGNNVGEVHVILKRKYRQYMNRKGGFNRPLDFVA